MSAGDLLEWLAAGLFVAGAYLATRQIWVPFLVAGGVFVYEAQCYGATRLPMPKLKLPRRRNQS